MFGVVVRLTACVAVGVVTLMSIDSNALALTGVKSRKVHATVPFDLAIDRTQAFGGLVTVEPRARGTGHTIVFQFDSTITVAGVASAVDAGGSVGTVSAAITGASNNEVSVTLSGIPDNKRITISLTGVNSAPTVFSVSLGFLLGDVNNSRSTASTDVSSVKARSGASAIGSTFLYDLNASGAVSSSDISAVKARAGQALAAVNDVSIAISKAGNGGGSVSSQPPRINCGSACAANFTVGTLVTLTAAPNVVSTFSGWSGACSGALPNFTLTLAASANCSAVFAGVPGNAALSWDPLVNPALSGYRVYYGNLPNVYLQADGQGFDVGNVTSRVVTGLTSGILYYFAVTAYDTSGRESEYSNEVSKVIP